MSEAHDVRTQGDRRRRPTPPFSRYTFIGRRREFRRTGEGPGTYVDRYSPGMMGLLIAIIGLCILDALFTLLYIQRGGGELNPLMAMAIEAGVLPFLAIKCGFTAIGIAFLCLHKNFRYVSLALWGIFVLYVALFGYHVYLVSIV